MEYDIQKYDESHGIYLYTCVNISLDGSVFRWLGVCVFLSHRMWEVSVQNFMHEHSRMQQDQQVLIIFYDPSNVPVCFIQDQSGI